MALHFSRDTKVYLEHSGSIWEIPVLDGFSFSQATNASEITLNEMSDTNGNSRRARQMFNDSYAPAEWSFASYMRPNASGYPVEDALWASFFTDATWNGTVWSGSSMTVSGSALTVSSQSSNKATLRTFNLYFVMGAGQAASANYTSSSSITIYKIANCIPNEASIDFEVDGIATINWSGFGKIITDEASFDASVIVARNVASTSNFIRNRLTQLSIVGDSNQSISGTYAVTLTGGNITFNNNITYLTPETLGVINQPLEHVTGTRNIGGNFTCYLGTNANESIDLFESLIEATSLVTNSFALTFTIGGATAPKVAISLPNCHLEIPQHSIEDVISLETTFHALPSNIDSADEVTIVYTGA